MQGIKNTYKNVFLKAVVELCVSSEMESLKKQKYINAMNS